MDGEDKQRIDADPKIRELRKKIEEARMRAKIFEAAKATEPDTLEDLEKEAGIEKEKRNPLPSLRTFESDAREMIRDNKESLASINLAESRRHPLHKSSAVGRAISVYISIIFLVLGVTSLAAIYYLGFRKEPEPVVVKSEFLIQANIRKDLNISGLSRAQLLDTISKEGAVNKISEVMSFNLINQNGKQVDSKQFLSLIAPNAPSVLVRSLGKEFEVGFFRGESNASFVVLRVDSFDNAYAGMLSWEKSLPFDLSGLIVRAPISGGEFADEIVKNKDTRVWRAGEESLLYSFVDKETLVITRDSATLKNILSKLVASKFVR